MVAATSHLNDFLRLRPPPLPSMIDWMNRCGCRSSKLARCWYTLIIIRLTACVPERIPTSLHYSGGWWLWSVVNIVRSSSSFVFVITFPFLLVLGISDSDDRPLLVCSPNISLLYLYCTYILSLPLWATELHTLDAFTSFMTSDCNCNSFQVWAILILPLLMCRFCFRFLRRKICTALFSSTVTVTRGSIAYTLGEIFLSVTNSVYVVFVLFVSSPTRQENKKWL